MKSTTASSASLAQFDGFAAQASARADAELDTFIAATEKALKIALLARKVKGLARVTRLQQLKAALPRASVAQLIDQTKTAAAFNPGVIA